MEKVKENHKSCCIHTREDHLQMYHRAQKEILSLLEPGVSQEAEGNHSWGAGSSQGFWRTPLLSIWTLKKWSEEQMSSKTYGSDKEVCDDALESGVYKTILKLGAWSLEIFCLIVKSDTCLLSFSIFWCNFDLRFSFNHWWNFVSCIFFLPTSH